MRLQRTRHGAKLAVGQVDVGQEIGGVGGVQIGRLGGVHGRAAAQRHEAVEMAVPGEVGGGEERFVGRLDGDLVENHGVDAGGL